MIFLLVPGFPADENDSTCLPAIQSFVEALARIRPARAIEIISFQYPFERRSYTWRGVRVIALGGANSRLRKPRTWMRAIRHFRRIRALHQSGFSAVIHSFWLGECALIGAVLARRFSLKHVVSIGGQEIRRPSIYSMLLRRAPFVLTAGSQYAADIAGRTLGREVDIVIPLGLDCDRVRAVGGSAERDIDILAAGSMTEVKRFEDVIDVTARLVQLHPRLRVVIAGDGPCRLNIQRAVEQSGLRTNVRLTGALPRPEILRLMRRSKLLLHPSEYESQGYVFLEALASGMYVVSRSVGYTGGSPKAVHCDGVAEMARACSRFLGSEVEYVPEEVLSADETARRFSALYLDEHYASDFGGTSHFSVP